VFHTQFVGVVLSAYKISHFEAQTMILASEICCVNALHITLLVCRSPPFVCGERRLCTTKTSFTRVRGIRDPTSCCFIHSKPSSWLRASAMYGRPGSVLKNDKAMVSLPAIN
jgi:hypothetical protein